MRRFFIPALFLALLGACTPKPVSVTHFTTSGNPEPISKSAKVTVTLTGPRIAAHENIEQLFWDEATQKGMALIGTDYVRHAPLVRAIDTPSVSLQPERLFTGLGRVERTFDPQTRDYRQEAIFKSVFIPEKSRAGQIIRLEDNRDIASMKDRTTLRFFSSSRVFSPAFFVIAERIQSEDLAFLKIIGWGRIIQSLDEPPVGDTPAPGGTLCLAEIEESSKEVEKGDIVFLLEVTGRAIAPPRPAAVTTQTAPAEIIVEPRWRPEPTLPGETK
ncbi:hypothetical protein [Desulfoplanes sp.]